MIMDRSWASHAPHFPPHPPPTSVPALPRAARPPLALASPLGGHQAMELRALQLAVPGAAQRRQEGAHGRGQQGRPAPKRRAQLDGRDWAGRGGGVGGR
ncbi:hypothetical protein F751_4804 [Auxenochlorella protothecoides]|uniref:Uncharacterized protein n=1 Tax=Auxenochlorella protothecoides TaxID=3075 RepID=A0A087SKQ7_AUXPR|nr:hypothetical protein F751_4804 [Auxenochlorella protothecoides]KFM26311.1 hypothetical protein F751_4804 [Auxenochlorella protothecoides]